MGLEKSNICEQELLQLFSRDTVCAMARDDHDEDDLDDDDLDDDDIDHDDDDIDDDDDLDDDDDIDHDDDDIDDDDDLDDDEDDGDRPIASILVPIFFHKI